MSRFFGLALYDTAHSGELIMSHSKHEMRKVPCMEPQPPQANLDCRLRGGVPVAASRLGSTLAES